MKMSWTCSSCTFINDNDAAVCEICAQKRSDYWLCSSCTYGCPLSSSKCTVCGALRPEGNKSTIQQLEGSEISRRQKRKECEYCNDDDESKRSSQVGAVEIKMRSGAYAFEEDYADGYNNFDISDQHKLNYHSRFPYDITTPHPSYKPTGSATIDANQTISAPESLDNDLVMENTKLSLQVQYVDEPTSLYSKVPKSSVSEKGSSMKRAKSLVTLENQQLTGKLSHEEVVTIIDEQLEPSILSSLIVLLNSCEPKMLYSVQAMPHATSLAWARVPLNVNVHSNTSINQVQTFKNCMNTGTNTMESVSSTTSLGKSLVQLCVPRIELAGVLYDKSTLARQHVGVLNNMNGNCNIELGALLPFSPIASLHQSSSPNESPSTSPTFGASSAPLSPSLTPSSQFPMWGPTVIICLKALDICKVYSPPKNGSAPKSTNNGTENLLKFLTRGASFYPIQRVTFIIEGLLSIIQRKLNRKKQKLIETAEEGVDRNESEQMLIRRARLAAIRQDAILELVRSYNINISIYMARRNAFCRFLVNFLMICMSVPGSISIY